VISGWWETRSRDECRVHHSHVTRELKSEHLFGIRSRLVD
jgi:hypothetical protein